MFKEKERDLYIAFISKRNTKVSCVFWLTTDKTLAEVQKFYDWVGVAILASTLGKGKEVRMKIAGIITAWLLTWETKFLKDTAKVEVKVFNTLEEAEDFIEDFIDEKEDMKDNTEKEEELKRKMKERLNGDRDVKKDLEIATEILDYLKEKLKK